MLLFSEEAMEESLLSINPTSVKFCQWAVRVIGGGLQTYSYEEKKRNSAGGDGQKVTCVKFVCYLVGKNPSEYVQATIPHKYGEPKHVQLKQDLLRDGTVWHIKNVHLLVGKGANASYNGAPNKNIGVGASYCPDSNS